MSGFRTYDRIKGWVDRVLALIGIIVLLPVFVVLIIVVKLRMGAPVFLIQKRPGLNGRPFAIYKFRTMNNLRDGNGKLLPDEKRLTPLGRWFRKSSLDELPEIFNVLKGEMSFVGPRPLLMEYLPLYTPEQNRRHEVKPGITGWAQVHGRNAITWEKKFELDVWYVQHRSFRLDLKILFMTIWKTFRAEGISAAGHATAPKFTGSPQ